MMALGDDAAKKVYAIVDEVAAIGDPLEQAQVATNVMHAIGSASEELRDLRHAAVVALKDEQGMGYQRIGVALGTSKSRAQQLYNGARSPRRPGVIEVETKLALTQLRGANATDEEIVKVLVPKIRAYRGGPYMPISQIAELLEVDPEWLATRISPPEPRPER
jgi:hypothetical protein